MWNNYSVNSRMIAPSRTSSTIYMFSTKVRRGLEDARLNGTFTQEEVEARLSKWLIE